MKKTTSAIASAPRAATAAPAQVVWRSPLTIDQTVAVLEIAPGTQVRWDRRALTSPAALAPVADVATDPTTTEGR